MITKIETKAPPQFEVYSSLKHPLCDPLSAVVNTVALLVLMNTYDQPWAMPLAASSFLLFYTVNVITSSIVHSYGTLGDKEKHLGWTYLPHHINIRMINLVAVSCLGLLSGPLPFPFVLSFLIHRALVSGRILLNHFLPVHPLLQPIDQVDKRYPLQLENKELVVSRRPPWTNRFQTGFYLTALFINASLPQPLPFPAQLIRFAVYSTLFVLGSLFLKNRTKINPAEELDKYYSKHIPTYPNHPVDPNLLFSESTEEPKRDYDISEYFPKNFYKLKTYWNQLDFKNNMFNHLSVNIYHIRLSSLYNMREQNERLERAHSILTSFEKFRALKKEETVNSLTDLNVFRVANDYKLKWHPDYLRSTQILQRGDYKNTETNQQNNIFWNSNPKWFDLYAAIYSKQLLEEVLETCKTFNNETTFLKAIRDCLLAFRPYGMEEKDFQYYLWNSNENALTEEAWVLYLVNMGVLTCDPNAEIPNFRGSKHSIEPLSQQHVNWIPIDQMVMTESGVLVRRDILPDTWKDSSSKTVLDYETAFMKRRSKPVDFQKTFTENGKFKITIPHNWTVKKTTATQDLLFHSIIDENARVLIHLLSIKNSSYPVGQQMCEDLEYIRNKYQLADNIPTQKTESNGNTTEAITGLFIHNKKEYVCLLTAKIRANLNQRFVALINSDEVEQLLPRYQKIIASYKFL